MGTTRVSSLAERGRGIHGLAPAAKVCLVNDANGQVAAGAGPKNIGTGRTFVSERAKKCHQSQNMSVGRT